jgi:hypothetical protein
LECFLTRDILIIIPFTNKTPLITTKKLPNGYLKILNAIFSY